MNSGPDLEQDPQLAALYRAGPAAEAPAHLDDAIRAAARREVAAGPRRSGFRRWQIPVSLAAVLVLSVSVVTQMREQGADRVDSLVLPPVAEALPAAADSAPARPVSPPAQRPAARPPVAAPAGPAAKAAAPAPAREIPQRAAGMASEMAGPATESRAKLAPLEEAGDSRREAAAARPMLRSAPAAAADVAVGGSAQSSAPAPAAVLSAQSPPPRLWDDLVRTQAPPEQWLQRIAELRRTGKVTDAELLAAEFRRRFPEQRLPEDAAR